MSDRAPSFLQADLFGALAEVGAIFSEVRPDRAIVPKDSIIGQWFERRMPEELQAQFPDRKVVIRSSAVEKKKGLWLQVPWIAFLRSDVTTMVTSGFYVAVLYRRELDGLYLTLMQATGNTNKVGARAKLRRKADALAHLIPRPPGFETGSVRLSDDSSRLSGFSRAYEESPILHRFYPFSARSAFSEDAPGDSFRSDLERIMRLYLDLPAGFLAAVVDSEAAPVQARSPLRERVIGRRRAERSGPAPVIDLEEALARLEVRTEAHERLLDEFQSALFTPSARDSTLCDLVVERSHLVEAKSLGASDDLAAARLAVGQLSLYKYLYREDLDEDPKLIALFDREPTAVAIGFLESVAVLPVWRDPRGWSTTTAAALHVCKVLPLVG